MSRTHDPSIAIPIPNTVVRRLAYETGKALDERDFQDEQDFHIAARRRHLLAAHDWGIVEGLALQTQDDPRTVTLTPGMAIDGFGRELVVESRQPVDLGLIERLGFDVEAIEVGLVYRRRSVRRGERGQHQCQRFVEQPELVFEVRGASEVRRESDARPAQPAHSAVDDGASLGDWVVPLGTLVPGRAPRSVEVDESVRRPAALIADKVWSADRTSCISFGEQALKVLTRDPSVAGGWLERFSVAPGGAARMRGPLELLGRVESGAVTFEAAGTPSEAKDVCRIYRKEDALRIDLPEGVGFEVWSVDADGKPVPVLAVRGDTVTIQGNLTASGAIVDKRAKPLAPAEDQAAGSPVAKLAAAAAAMLGMIMQFLTVGALALVAWMLIQAQFPDLFASKQGESAVRKAKEPVTKGTVKSGFDVKGK